jgi:hypothetical protein
LANKRGAPGGIISLQGRGIIQESLGAIIPLQTGGFVGIGSGAHPRRHRRGFTAAAHHFIQDRKNIGNVLLPVAAPRPSAAGNR